MYKFITCNKCGSTVKYEINDCGKLKNKAGAPQVFVKVQCECYTRTYRMQENIAKSESLEQALIYLGEGWLKGSDKAPISYLLHPSTEEDIVMH